MVFLNNIKRNKRILVKFFFSSNGSVFPGKFINVSLKHRAQAHNPLLLYVYCMFIMLKFTTITIKLHYLPLLLIQYGVLFLPSLLIKFLPFFVEFLLKKLYFSAVKISQIFGSIQNNNLNFPAIQLVQCSSLETENTLICFDFRPHRMCGEIQILILHGAKANKISGFLDLFEKQISYFEKKI